MNRSLSGLLALSLLLFVPGVASAERRSLTMAKRLAEQAGGLADGQRIVLDQAGKLDLGAMASSAGPVRTVDLRALSGLERAASGLGATVRRFNAGKAPAMKAGETLTISRVGDSVTIVTHRASGRSTRRSFFVERPGATDRQTARVTHVSSGVRYRTGRTRLFKLDTAALGRAMITPKPSAPITVSGTPLERLPVVGLGRLPLQLGRQPLRLGRTFSARRGN